MKARAARKNRDATCPTPTITLTFKTTLQRAARRGIALQPSLSRIARPTPPRRSWCLRAIQAPKIYARPIQEVGLDIMDLRAKPRCRGFAIGDVDAVRYVGRV